MKLTHGDIAEIIRILDTSTLDEIVIEVDGLRVEARRRVNADTATLQRETPVIATPRRYAAPAPPVLESTHATRPETDPVETTSPRVSPAELAPGQLTVTAPMVGTFYRRPSPDAPPFVEVGSRIDANDPLCLVEVMKLYTTMFATSSGTVARICAEDATLVEYEQLLFVIDAD